MPQSNALPVVQRPDSRPVGSERVYYIDEGQHLRCIHTRKNAAGKYVPTGVEERVSFPLVQATIAKAEGRPDLHPTELGYTELGAGRFRRKIKKAAKKIGRSKVFKAVKKVGRAALSFVPGGGAITTGIDAAKMVRNVVSGELGAAAPRPVPVKVAKRAVPPVKAAAAAAALRKTMAPTSTAATTVKGARLREARIAEAGKVLATMPKGAARAAAAKKAATRIDSYKVITPEGKEIFVARSALSL